MDNKPKRRTLSDVGNSNITSGNIRIQDDVLQNDGEEVRRESRNRVGTNADAGGSKKRTDVYVRGQLNSSQG